MKAAPDAQLHLLELQELDTSLDRLARRRRALPELAELQEISDRLHAVADEIVAVDTEIADLRRSQSKAEADVDQVRARAARDQRRLDAGQVSSPRELESLQSEIASLHRRQSDLEEIVLEIMERREDAERRRETLLVERQELTARREVVEERRDAGFRELDAEAARLGQQRVEMIKEIPDDLLSLYDRLREQHGGVGAAALRSGRCEGCKLALSTSDLARIRSAPPDEVIRCEECRRILVRVPTPRP